jgi:serine/threonine protein kinase
VAACVVCQSEVADNARFCPSCGAEQPRTSSIEGDDPMLGRVIARNFKIEKLLGVGGMGKVYKARQLSLDKDVVIKVLHEHFQHDPQLVQRFQREARAASRLNHPNSIQVIDFGQDDTGVLFMAIEYLHGTDLFAVLQREGPLGEDRLARVMIQVCSALVEAHEQNVIHRDLKPENIMVEDRRGRKDVVKVLDFGIAKIQDPDEKGGQALTQAGMVCGTPEYMSPEQARGQTLDKRSDLYSLGVVVYQLATGELPFTAESPIGIVTKHILEKPAPPRQKYPHLRISADLEAIILKAMAKEPADRYLSAHDMGVAFEKLLAKSGAKSTSATMVGLASQASLVGASSTEETIGPEAENPIAAPAREGSASSTATGAVSSPSGAPATASSTKVQMSATGPRLTAPTPTNVKELIVDVPAAANKRSMVPLAAGGAVVVVLAIVAAVVLMKGDSAVVEKPTEPGTGVVATTTDAKPDDTKPVDTKPVDTKPDDTKPVDTKPVDTKPVDAKPVDAKPVDAKPDDTKPVDTKPVDTKPVDTKPDGALTRPPKGDKPQKGTDPKPDDGDENQPGKKPDKPDKPDKPSGRSKAVQLVRDAQDLVMGKNPEEGYRLLKEAIRADPSYPEPKRFIAFYWLKKGQNDKACTAMRDFVKQKGNSLTREQVEQQLNVAKCPK